MKKGLLGLTKSSSEFSIANCCTFVYMCDMLGLLKIVVLRKRELNSE